MRTGGRIQHLRPPNITLLVATCLMEGVSTPAGPTVEHMGKAVERLCKLPKGDVCGRLRIQRGQNGHIPGLGVRRMIKKSA